MLWQTKATNLCCQTANEWCRIDTLVCVSIWGPSAPTEAQEEEEEEDLIKIQQNINCDKFWVSNLWTWREHQKAAGAAEAAEAAR